MALDVLSPLTLLLLILLPILYLFFAKTKTKTKTNAKSYTPPTKSPYLTPYPIIGHSLQYTKNNHRVLDWFTDCLAASPTNTVVLRRVGLRAVSTANEANVEYVLRSNFDNYPKGHKVFFLFHDFLGRGIFNADGEAWRIQRKTASYEFNTKSLRSFVVKCVQQEISDRLLPLLAKASIDGSIIDLEDVLQRFGFDNICKVAFNVDPACMDDGQPDVAQKNFSKGFAAAFNDATELALGRVRYSIPIVWVIKRLLCIGTERRLKNAVKTIHDFALQIIRSRVKDQQQEEDLLSRFIAIGQFSEEGLRDIVVSFLLAGRDTSSSALTWFFWLLSRHRSVEAKIVAEIRAAREGSPRKGSPVFDFEELKEMHYLHAALTESMRLYPPVPINTRVCASDDVLPDGTAIKKGDFMTYNAFAMGRMKAIWGEDCREYRPERWLDGEGRFVPASPFKFTAFHAGPRMCLGKEMAYIQMKSIVACVLERFVVGVVEMEKEPVKLNSLTLRMKGGLPVGIRERCVLCTSSTN